jgi:cytochrome oxidase Cu insertion factor (SCO1/SenC/PrrC family)
MTAPQADEFHDAPYRKGRRWRLAAATFVLFVVPATIVGGIIWGMGLLKAIEPSERFLVDPGTPIGDFTLYSHQGDTLTRETFIGKVWIAHAWSPDCGEPCEPRLRAVRDVQYALSKYKHLRLLSLSLEPEQPVGELWTTGRRFSNYAGWHFAGGTAANVTTVMDGVGLSGRTFALGSPVEVALIDPSGRPRGWYAPTDSSGYRDLINDAVYLLREYDEAP